MHADETAVHDGEVEAVVAALDEDALDFQLADVAGFLDVALAGLQADRGEDIFTLNLETLQNPAQKLRQLLPLLNGTRDLPDLVSSLGWPPAEAEENLRFAASHALLLS